jgi:hypothetical protein
MWNSHEAVVHIVGVNQFAGDDSKQIDRQRNGALTTARSGARDVKQSYVPVTGANKTVKDGKSVVVVPSRRAVRGNGDGVCPGTAGPLLEASNV